MWILLLENLKRIANSLEKIPKLPPYSNICSATSQKKSFSLLARTILDGSSASLLEKVRFQELTSLLCCWLLRSHQGLGCTNQASFIGNTIVHIDSLFRNFLRFIGDVYNAIFLSIYKAEMNNWSFIIEFHRASSTKHITNVPFVPCSWDITKKNLTV